MERQEVTASLVELARWIDREPLMPLPFGMRVTEHQVHQRVDSYHPTAEQVRYLLDQGAKVVPLGDGAVRVEMMVGAILFSTYHGAGYEWEQSDERWRSVQWVLHERGLPTAEYKVRVPTGRDDEDDEPDGD